MYNKAVIDKLITFIEQHNGIGNKTKLAELVQHEFSLVKAGKVYYSDDFAIRYSWNSKNNSKKSIILYSHCAI